MVILAEPYILNTMDTAAGVRGRTRRRRPPRHWPAALAVVLALGAAAAGWLAFRHMRRAPGPPPGDAVFLADAAQLRREMLALEHRMPDEGAAREYERALALASRGDSAAALASLRAVAAAAPVPAVFNNLGVLYARIGDPLNARHAWREALRLDPGYTAARANLARLKIPGSEAQPPVSQEMEPNNSPLNANTIAMGATVGGATGDPGDKDCFRFRTPGGPRDIVEIAIENRSKALVPALRVLDSDRRYMDWAKAAAPGANLSHRFSPEPGSVVYVEVWGHEATLGAYGIRAQALASFDRYEPNEDVLRARPIAFGGSVEAGIMDARDNDCFEFESPRAGRVSIRVENRSTTLVPSLGLFGPDRRLMEFAPPAERAGAGLNHEFEAMAGRRYYLQLWGRNGTAGQYTLTTK